MTRIITATLILLSFTLYGQTSNESTVIFVRKKMSLGLLGDINIFVDGNLVCRLDNNSYYSHTLPPGKHSFTVQYSGKEAKEREAIDLNLQQGNTHVLKAIIEKTNSSSKLLLEEITITSWERTKEGLKPSFCK